MIYLSSGAFLLVIGYLLYRNYKLRASLAEKNSNLDELQFIINYETDTERTVSLLVNNLHELSKDLLLPIATHLTMKFFRKLLSHKETNSINVVREVKILTEAINNSQFGDIVSDLLPPLINEQWALKKFSTNLKGALADKNLGEKMQSVASFLPEPGKKAFVGSIISIDDYVSYILCIIPWNYNKESFRNEWKNMTEEQKCATTKVVKFQQEILYELQSEGCRRDVAEMLKFVDEAVVV